MSRITHGQSDYTEIKQRHLQIFLQGCTMGWMSWLRRNPHAPLVVIDCTSGSGYTEKGDPGSPLILNRFFHEKFNGHFRQLCCENDKKNYNKLTHLDLIATDIHHGRYQTLILPWLDSLGTRDLSGILYCDVNGIKDALDGMHVFQLLQKNQKTSHIDLAFNFSLNAYKRHQAPGVVQKLYHGEPPEWAVPDLLTVLDGFAALKKKTFVRCEIGKLSEWLMLYCMNTGTVRLTRRNELIVPYEEWRANAEHYLKGGQKVAPNQLRMPL